VRRRQRKTLRQIAGVDGARIANNPVHRSKGAPADSITRQRAHHDQYRHGEQQQAREVAQRNGNEVQRLAHFDNPRLAAEALAPRAQPHRPIHRLHIAVSRLVPFHARGLRGNTVARQSFRLKNQRAILGEDLKQPAAPGQLRRALQFAAQLIDSGGGMRRAKVMEIHDTMIEFLVDGAVHAGAHGQPTAHAHHAKDQGNAEQIPARQAKAD